MSKYYRNAITVEWLSNEPWGDEATDLETVNYEITDGMSIGYITRTATNIELTKEQVEQADISYGGDGSFITSLDEDDMDEDGDMDEDANQDTAIAPGGVVHQLAGDGTMTRCGRPAAGWSRAVTDLQRLGLVVFCADCQAGNK